MTDKKVLPADVYDTMELIAEAYGGIGADTTVVYKTGDDYFSSPPCCIIGFCEFALDVKLDGYKELYENIFVSRKLNYVANNLAVYKVLGLPTDIQYNREVYDKNNPKRISWQEWCDELNVVRGE